MLYPGHFSLLVEGVENFVDDGLVFLADRVYAGGYFVVLLFVD